MDIMLARILECIGSKHGETKKLALHLDIHPNAISNWRHGRTKSYIKYLPAIAEFYDVSIEYLEGKTEDKGSYQPRQLYNYSSYNVEPADGKELEYGQLTYNREIDQPKKERKIEYKTTSKKVVIPIEALSTNGSDNPFADPLMQLASIRATMNDDDNEQLTRELTAIFNYYNSKRLYYESNSYDDEEY